MSDETEKDTERAAVRTYVPAYQKDEWQDHADDLGMSLSEFVRTMVQAGRTDFEIPDPPDAVGSTPPAETETGGGSSELDLKQELIATLAGDGHTSWETIVDEVSIDFEDHLYDVLEELEEEGRVNHDPRKGGYTLVDE